MLDPAVRLRNAIIGGNLAITKRLLARFPELWLNVDPAHNGWCNLHYASFYGHYLVCFHLVSQMARGRLHEPSLCDLDLVTFDGLTVLHMPLWHHHSQTLHFLLQEFSGARWLDRRGGPVLRTPLHYCCVSRFIDGVKLLLEYGADWRLPDANGDTCLHLCFAYGGLKCIEALLLFVMADALRQHKDAEGAKAGFLAGSPDRLREYLHSVVAECENPLNARGQRPICHAASFEMERQYHVQKRLWIKKLVDDEIALHTAPRWDAALLVPDFSADRSTRPSYGTSMLASYKNIASVSRTSLDSDMLETSNSSTDAYNSAATSRAPGPRDKNEKPVGSDEERVGRKHLRSLPLVADLDVMAASQDLHKPGRQHAKSLALNSRCSPLMTRSLTASQAFQAPPISPLQVEFTSAQSRRPSFALLLMRLPLKSEAEPQTEAKLRVPSSEKASESPEKSATLATPILGSFVNQLTFSPLSQTRRRSGSGLWEDTQSLIQSSDSAKEHPSRNNDTLKKHPSSSLLRKESSTETLKRNLSTPARLANVFRSNESPTALLRENRKPSTSGSPSKISPSQLPGTNCNANENPLVPNSALKLELSAQADKNFLFMLPRQHKNSQQKSLPNLRESHAQDARTSGDEDEPILHRNVRSISFARVREE